MDAKLKRKVWERDNYECQHPIEEGIICGSTLLDKAPHHIIFKGMGGGHGKDEESNLVTLCPDHHREVHTGKNSKYWRKHWEAWKEERLGGEWT